VLVLDEPTNHLDIPSREALEEALSAYEGTIITISHDRYFLDRVATQILALDGAGGAEHYDGDYTEYHDWKLSIRNESVPVETVSQKPIPKVAKKKKTDGRTPDQIETDISQAEARLNEISQQMGTPEVARDADRLIALNDEYQQTETLLKSLYEEWDRVSEEPARA
jgi:ATP-binding cassette subfamily F protein 3